MIAPDSKPSLQNAGLPLWCRFENILPPESHIALFSSVVSCQSQFVASRTILSASGYRRSKILMNAQDILADFDRIVQKSLPVVVVALGLEPFSYKQISAQITVHNDGDFYKIHSDSGHPTMQHRKVTFVYYFHPEPHVFSGGELILYDYMVQRKNPTSAGRVTIAPQGNTIVFFPSDVQHEVCPVTCPSFSFEDGRFTINGWISC